MIGMIARRRFLIGGFVASASLGWAFWAFGPFGLEPATAEPRVHDDIALLERLIALPKRPETVRFQIRRRGETDWLGPSENDLFVLLRYGAADHVELRAGLERARSQVDDVALPTLEWLGADTPLDPIVRTHGGLLIQAEDRRSAEPFARSPYFDGDAIPLADGRHVLVVMGTS